MPDRKTRGVIPLDTREERLTEDDMTQLTLGPRGIPGEPFPFKMTPERKKKTFGPSDPGHTA